MIITGYVKYTMSFKHQLWKQKGEEYRIHGRWGWLWIRTPRNFQHVNSRELGLAAGPRNLCGQGIDIDKTEAYKEEEMPEVLKNIEIVPPVTEFEEIDVTKALLTPGRTRVQLKVLEERKIAQSKTEDGPKEEEIIDVDAEDDANNEGLEKQLNNMMTGKVSLPNNTQTYTSIAKLAKDFQCYVKGCNSGAGNSIENTCYSPLCMQRVKVRKDLLGLLRKANVATNAPIKLPVLPQLTNTPVKKTTSILEQTLKAPQLPLVTKEKEIVVVPTKESICKDLVNAVMTAPKVEDEMKDVYVPLKEPTVKKEIKEEKPENINIVPKEETGEHSMESPPVKKFKKESNSEEEKDIDVKEMSPDAIKEMILGATVTTSQTMVDGIISSLSASENTVDNVSVTSSNNGIGQTIQTLNSKSTVYSAQQNRRFCAYKVGVKREERTVKTEHAEDGTERIYSTLSTEGKLTLKKLTNTVDIKRKKRQIVKYPACSTFLARKGCTSLLVLPQHETRKLARNAGRIQIPGFHALAKANNNIWPYPCSRPLFKTCWIYRTVNLKSLACAALQLKILWACLRWDDMQTKPPNTDGKHQITTETEILSLELLKHRHVGQFMEKTQYLRRKVVIPLELPKTVREKRKRPESPQSMDPQVTEEWVDEEKLELWEIKQYGEK
ncbi:hypothetical protein NQ314_019208 [Rhamnusium bicolor]|uniref:Uncharacterized protein n=1 Tax=Rhamnusium bicolor TaxID=1586634 RepID=A0AAV8WQ26_9CUCU|nr:hypothetical protein NQ314_019208 [Rhamnusium bicolor]